MKSIFMIAIAATFLLPTCVVADWTGASSIRDESFYVASTGLSLGAWTTVQGGTAYASSGYAITSPFQINLEYQDGILDSDIANINTYLYPADAALPPGHTDGDWTVNFTDCEEYALNINPGGGLTVYEFEGLAETYDPNIEWTLTGWHQTILAGDIVDNNNGTVTLRVLPAGTYRPFVGDPPVNNVEIFDGNLDTEVLGYTFVGAACNIGDGSVLGVNLVPEPSSVLLLVFGLVGLLVRRGHA